MDVVWPEAARRLESRRAIDAAHLIRVVRSNDEPVPVTHSH
jgi:hypothetical protein